MRTGRSGSTGTFRRRRFMFNPKKWATTMALTLGAVAARAAEPPVQAPPSTRELMSEIQRLEARGQQPQATQEKYGTRDVDATLAAVLKDADRHSMLIDGTGVTSGFSIEKGFFISNED